MKIITFKSVGSAIVLNAAVMSSVLYAAPSIVPMPPVKSIILAQTNQGAGGAGGDTLPYAEPGRASSDGHISGDDRVFLKRYTAETRYPSIRAERTYSIGDEVPGSMTYYEINGRPSMSGYRYAIINDRTVLINPRTRRVVEVID